jgi:hypothetical protein
MHYGIGPEVYAKYRREQLLANATPDQVVHQAGSREIRRVSGTVLRVRVGSLLIVVGQRLAGDITSVGRDERQPA